MSPQKVVLADAFRRFSDRWSPKIVGEVNDVQVKVGTLNTGDADDPRTVREPERL